MPFPARSPRPRNLCRAASAIVALVVAGVATADEWPQFRGSDGSGYVAAESLPLTWSESEGVAWKTPIPGRGWSSPAVVDGKIWLTTAEESELTDAEREERKQKLVAQPYAAFTEAAGTITLSAVEVDAESGEVLRQVKLFEVNSPEPIHGLNSFASPSPVIAGGRCFCHFGRYGTACFDLATGEILWRQTLEIDHMVGPGSSPIVVGDLLIIPCDGGDKQFIAALDVATGQPRWQVDRPPMRSTNPDARKAFSTPLAIDVDGRTMVVIPGAQWFVAYDPTSGDEIWRVDHGEGFSNVPRPVFDGERVYLCTGYVRGQLWAVRPDGNGDVTATHVAWKGNQQVPTMPSPVVADGRIYLISDGGVATCLDAATGKMLWRERVGGNFSSSPLCGAGRVYFSGHDGRTTVVAASGEYEKLAENTLDGQVMASPAIVDGDLLLRTESHLYRISGE